jgi:hypothetical protein
MGWVAPPGDPSAFHPAGQSHRRRPPPGKQTQAEKAHQTPITKKHTAESDPGGVFVFTYLSISVKPIIDIAEGEKRG